MNRSLLWFAIPAALLLCAGCGGGKPDSQGKGAGSTGPPAYGDTIIEASIGEP